MRWFSFLELCIAQMLLEEMKETFVVVVEEKILVIF